MRCAARNRARAFARCSISGSSTRSASSIPSRIATVSGTTRPGAGSRRGPADRPSAAVAAGRRPACRRPTSTGRRAASDKASDHTPVWCEMARGLIRISGRSAGGNCRKSHAVEEMSGASRLVEAQRQAVPVAELIAEFERAMQHQRRPERAPQRIVRKVRVASGAAEAQIAEEPAAVEEVPAEPA